MVDRWMDGYIHGWAKGGVEIEGGTLKKVPVRTEPVCNCQKNNFENLLVTRAHPARTSSFRH